MRTGTSFLTYLDLTYARDVKGKITSITSTDAGESCTYGYGVLDRLISATNSAGTQSWSYDDSGNIMSGRQ